MEESLPNIKGSLGTTQAYSLADVISRTAGAFEFTYGSGGPSGGGGDTKGVFTFDASRSSSTYKGNAPVRPLSLLTAFLIKY